jgi:hypothetical protein
MLCLTNSMKLDDGLDEKVVTGTWSWPRPDMHTYALLVQGLATSLRVNDAIRIIAYVCGMGISSGEEVQSVASSYICKNIPILFT